MEDIDKLYMPSRIPKRKEYFTGFGDSEIIPTCIMAAISIVMGVIYYTVSKNVIGTLLIPALLIGVTVVLIIKDQQNESFLEKLKFMYVYSKSQKTYLYKFENPYGRLPWENTSGRE